MNPLIIADTLDAVATETTRTPPPTEAQRQRILTATHRITTWCTGQNVDAFGLCRRCGTRLGRDGAGHPLDSCMTVPLRELVRLVRRAGWYGRKMWQL